MEGGSVAVLAMDCSSCWFSRVPSSCSAIVWALGGSSLLGRKVGSVDACWRGSDALAKDDSLAPPQALRTAATARRLHSRPVRTARD